MQQEDLEVDEIEIEKEWKRRERENRLTLSRAYPRIYSSPTCSEYHPSQKTRSQLFPLCLSTLARRRAPP
jgi:hypothetical protein